MLARKLQLAPLDKVVASSVVHPVLERKLQWAPFD